MSKSKFSTKEDEVISCYTNLYPLNILYGLELASILLNKSRISVQNRYYYTIRSGKTTVVSCGSSQGFSHNVKNLWRDKDGNLPKQKLVSVKKVLIQMLSLSKAERESILAHFKPSTESQSSNR